MEVYATPVRSRGFRMTCDMRSDTCSDGRRITTVRATPVPCETSPGVWEMVPEDTGCYSVRGLESWAATTSYLAYGAELDNPAWSGVAGGTVEVLPDGYRIHPAPGSHNSGVLQRNLDPVSPGGETRTFACIVRTHRPAYIRYWFSGSISASFPVVDTGGRWEVLSATRTLPDTAVPSATIGNGPASEDPVPFDVAGCWVTKTDTPGRPCWGGEAPVTCAADRHTISTEGWPTEAGEISITWELAETCPPGVSCFVFDGRLSGGDTTSPFHIWINSAGNVTISFYSVVFASIGQQPAPGVLTTVTARRRDGVLEIYRDGTLVTAKAADPFVWNSESNLGRRFVDATFQIGRAHV